MRTNASNSSIPCMSSNSSTHGTGSFHGSGIHGNPSHGSFGLHRSSFGLSNPGSLTPTPSSYDEFVRRKIPHVIGGHDGRPGGESRQSIIRSLENSLNGGANKKFGVVPPYGGETLSAYKKKSRSTITSREASRENVSSRLCFSFVFHLVVDWCS